jgi:hypothetical protein
MSDQADNLRQLVRAHRQWRRPDGPPLEPDPAAMRIAGPGPARDAARPRVARGDGWLARAARRALGLPT